MKKIIIIMLFSVITFHALSQDKANNGLADKSEISLLGKSSLTVDKAGIPVYFNVLRLNGELIGILPAKYNDNVFMKKSYGKYNLGGEITFIIPMDKFTNDQIAELTSKYKVYAADGYLNLNINKYSGSSLRFTKLPDYLKFSVEKLSFK